MPDLPLAPTSMPSVVDALGQIADAGGRLAGLPVAEWDGLAGGGLLEAVHVVARVRAQLDAVLLEATARIETTGAAGAAGWGSTKDFLTHALGGQRGAGSGIVRAAQQLGDLGPVREVLGAGRISYAQAQVIGREVAGLPRDAVLREAAADRLLARAVDEAVDATGLRLAMPDIVRELDPDRAARAAEAERQRAERNAHHQRHLSLVPDAWGGVKVRGYGTVEDAELIKTVLMPLAAPVTTEPGACGGTPPGQTWATYDEHGPHPVTTCPDQQCGHDGRDPRDPRDPRDHGTRMWDALVEVCHRVHAAGDLPQQHGTETRLVVTITEEALRDRTGFGVLLEGERLSVAAVRRLACDTEILPAVLGAEGQVLDVGRARRLVTSAIWLALVLRDGHCTFPGCTRLPVACDAHHLTHWAEGGPTSLDNLTLLCRRHHVLTHHSPWTVTLDPATRRPVWSPPPRRAGPSPYFTYEPPTRPPPAAATPLAS